MPVPPFRQQPSGTGGTDRDARDRADARDACDAAAPHGLPGPPASIPLLQHRPPAELTIGETGALQRTRHAAKTPTRPLTAVAAGDVLDRPARPVPSLRQQRDFPQQLARGRGRAHRSARPRRRARDARQTRPTRSRLRHGLHRPAGTVPMLSHRRRRRPLPVDARLADRRAPVRGCARDAVENHRSGTGRIGRRLHRPPGAGRALGQRHLTPLGGERSNRDARPCRRTRHARQLPIRERPSGHLQRGPARRSRPRRQRQRCEHHPCDGYGTVSHSQTTLPPATISGIRMLPSGGQVLGTDPPRSQHRSPRS